MDMVRGKFLSGMDDLSEVREIRSKTKQWADTKELIFESQELRDTDASCMHVVCYVAEKPVATGRISFDGWEYVMSGVCVRNEAQKNKIGDFAVRMLLDRAFSSGAQEIVLECPIEVQGFFEKIGFSQTEKKVPAAGAIWMCMTPADIHKCCHCK